MRTEDYKENNGMFFKKETPDEVCKILTNCYTMGQRIKIYYGCAKTGRDWLEEFDTVGTVGKSTGPIKIPLMINNSRSTGGSGILDHCILKIKETKTGRIIYQHPKYKTPVIEIVPSDMKEYEYNTIVNGGLVRRHKSMRSAKYFKSRIQ